MHILVTGAAGRVGSHTVRYLLARQHTITAVDLVPLSSTLLNSVPAPDRQRLHTATCDLTNYERFESILSSAPTPVEGIVHLGSIPDPTKHDSRVVHNSNVAGSYNVMETAGKLGIKRVVQASSVNATGLSYTPEHNHRLPDLPFREDITPLRPEDSYALSKLICEAQASAVARFWAPQLRIASLRFHFCVPNRQYAVEHAVPRDMFSWTSFDACASACLLALTSEGWDGHEVFNIAAKDIIHHGTLDDHTAIDMDRTPLGTLEILEKHWSGRYGKLDEEWWKNDKRRAIWDSTKAERILGWNHDRSGEL